MVVSVLLVWVFFVAAAIAKREEMKCGKEETDLFVVHWTHVPKAGGTAMAKLAKRVACAQNQALMKNEKGEWINPCCVPSLCLSEISCFATASTCPFVQGIGKHTSSMSKMVDMPCCSTQWYDSTRTSFLRTALRGPPDMKTLANLGIRQNEFGDYFSHKATAEGMLSRLRSLKHWPMIRRVEFFAKTGVPEQDIIHRCQETKLYQLGYLDREETLAVIRNASKVKKRSGSMLKTTQAASRCHRAAEAIHFNEDYMLAQDRRHPRARKLLPQNQAHYNWPCCTHKKAGANSMALLRQPFTRLASAYFYRGHNPNSDNYGLRPEIWTSTYNRYHGTTSRPELYSFRYFIEAYEYREILTKMFGDSFGCSRTQRCGGRPSCAPLAECHAYRNATEYLSLKHLQIAKNAISNHRFIGLLEAYNTSVKLAMRTFGVPPSSDGSEFGASRRSYSLNQRCSGAIALRSDPQACRAAFALNPFDVNLYEHAHRLFCQRVQDSGLMDDDPEVVRELNSKQLCSNIRYNDPEHVCGLLETPEAKAKLKDLQLLCGAQQPRRFSRHKLEEQDAAGTDDDDDKPRRVWKWGFSGQEPYFASPSS